MNVLDEVKEVIEIKVQLKGDVLAQKLFDKAVDPLMLKLVDLIPTEIDDAFYDGKKEELKVLFTELVKSEMDKLQGKIEDTLGQSAE